MVINSTLVLSQHLKQPFEQHEQGLSQFCKHRWPLYLSYFVARPDRTEVTQSEKFFKLYQGKMDFGKRLTLYFTD